MVSARGGRPNLLRAEARRRTEEVGGAGEDFLAVQAPRDPKHHLRCSRENR